MEGKTKYESTLISGSFLTLRDLIHDVDTVGLKLSYCRTAVFFCVLASAFLQDFQLLYNNCYTYNPPEHDISLMCRNLENVYKDKIARMPAQVNLATRLSL